MSTPSPSQALLNRPVIDSNLANILVQNGFTADEIEVAIYPDPAPFGVNSMFQRLEAFIYFVVLLPLLIPSAILLGPTYAKYRGTVAGFNMELNRRFARQVILATSSQIILVKRPLNVFEIFVQIFPEKNVEVYFYNLNSSIVKKGKFIVLENESSGNPKNLFLPRNGQNQQLQKLLHMSRIKNNFDEASNDIEFAELISERQVLTVGETINSNP
eukprot:snap_masked-scaffold_33-processed-gene-0.46-mRNA-1 protein AED:1.00 eAED:1.00 QI:0/0/0/0/1/1/2/0/214